MNATEFMVARGEMCKYYYSVIGGCSRKGEKCPLHSLDDCQPYAGMTVQDAERMQAIVDKWMHRDEETNADKFREIFGEEFMDMWRVSNELAEEWAQQRYEK